MLAFNICIEQEGRLRAADGKAGNLPDRDHSWPKKLAKNKIFQLNGEKIALHIV